MTTERKWKRGDIGPDGRVFWSYKKSCKNGEWWVLLENLSEMIQKSLEYTRKHREVNPEKIREYSRKYYAKNSEKVREKVRAYQKAIPDKIHEKNRKWRQANREKALELKRNIRKKQREQTAADQFFIMAGAAESISQLK